jgi:hypothetical protein
MKTILNPDVKVIYRKTDEVFLKNSFTNTLFSLSEGEFEVLSHYCKIEDSEKTIQYFQEKYDFDKDFLDALIQKSKEIEIIETEEYLQKKEKKSKPFSPIMNYCIGIFNNISNLLGLRTKFIFRGNLRFFKIFTIDLKGTLLDKIAISKLGQNVLLISYWLISLISIIGLINIRTERLSMEYILNLSPSITIITVFLIVLGILLSTFLHEFGHYLLYKRYGGETSEMGFALVLGMLPFMYVSTNSLYLWDNKQKRMIVTGAGIMVDLLLASIILWSFILTSNQQLAFILIFFLYYISIRVIFNLMPFIPATDGYFLLTDVISNPSLFYDAGKSSKKTWQHFKTFNFKEIKTKELFYMAYLLSAYIFITAYYSLMGIIILVPFLIRLFYS